MLFLKLCMYYSCKYESKMSMEVWKCYLTWDNVQVTCISEEGHTCRKQLEEITFFSFHYYSTEIGVIHTVRLLYRNLFEKKMTPGVGGGGGEILVYGKRKARWQWWGAPEGWGEMSEKSEARKRRRGRRGKESEVKKSEERKMRRAGQGTETLERSTNIAGPWYRFQQWSMFKA